MTKLRRTKGGSFEPDYFKRDRTQDKNYRKRSPKGFSLEPVTRQGNIDGFKASKKGKFKNPYGWP